MLDPLRLRRLLSPQAWGYPLIQLSCVDSTNRILLEWSRVQGSWLRSGTTLIATRQRAGHGQYGRPWHSPAGGLYLSVLFYPDASADQVLPLTLTLVWGVVAELRCQLLLPIGVKWPNDLILEGRKLGGLLVQSRCSGDRVQVAVAGLGLNVNQPVPNLGISLVETWGHPLDLTTVAAWVLRGLERGYHLWQEQGWLGAQSQYLSWMGHLRQPVVLPDQTSARVLGVAADGNLQVETQGGILGLEPGQIRLGYPVPSRLAADPIGHGHS